MSTFIALASSIIDAVKGFRDNARQDERDADRRRLDSIKEPIPPPRFYRTIALRDKNVMDSADPYSTMSIRDSLRNDVIPTGYSLEQLSSVGFSEEVNSYKKRRGERIMNQRKVLKDSLNSVVNLLQKSFPDLAEDDKRALQQAGLFNDRDVQDLVSKVKRWIMAVDKNQLDSQTASDILQIVQSRLELTQDALDRFQLDKDIQDKISEAQGKRDNTILEFVQRSLRYK